MKKKIFCKKQDALKFAAFVAAKEILVNNNYYIVVY